MLKVYRVTYLKALSRPASFKLDLEFGTRIATEHRIVSVGARM